MKLARSIKLERELATRIREVFCETIHFARTHEEHLDRMTAVIWHSSDYKLAPRWLHTFLHGVSETYSNMLYVPSLDFGNNPPNTPSNSPLCWVLIGPDSRMFGERDEDWLKESSEYKSAMHGTHAWRYEWNQGQFRPY